MSYNHQNEVCWCKGELYVESNNENNEEDPRNEVKKQKGAFISMLLGTLGDSLLGNLLTGKGTIRVGEGAVAASQGQGTIRAGQHF